MHVIFRESAGLDDAATPQDLGQTPGDLVVLSFSDSDLGVFGAAWHEADGGLPSLRLANLSALTHPLSVDTYLDQTLAQAKGVLIRLIGGVSYWSYGLQQLSALAEARGIAVAVLPADGRRDRQLEDHSTLPVSTLHRLSALCDTGGTLAARAALAQLALAAGLYAKPVLGQKTLPDFGAWNGKTLCDPVRHSDRPLAIITFYRAYLAAADMGPITAMMAALEARGYETLGLFVPSLKAPKAAAWLAGVLRDLAPDAVINATAFSGKTRDGTSPLEQITAPVFQVALATNTRKKWAEADRGLSPADLAMHVVLPEVDGRIFAGAVSFKDPSARDDQLEFSRLMHCADDTNIAMLADRVAAWGALAATAPMDKRIAMVLSSYPNKAWNMAHAVGLDVLASADALSEDLADAGYHIETGPPLDQALKQSLTWDIGAYRAALADLPEPLRKDLETTWGAPETDPAYADGAFHFKAVRRGHLLVALQPERGQTQARDEDYHDLSRVPCHGYVAFYLWLRSQSIHALVHMGAHGTLEWLPGKSVALSNACWPQALIGACPVIYPFIVNDPGEAAQAKRRIGAVTIGHIPPAMKSSQTPDRYMRLEMLLDEFSNADGLDPKRRDRLQSDIRNEAEALGLGADLGLDAATSLAEALTRIDRFVCDIKESQYGDGLHIFGRGGTDSAEEDMRPSVVNERAAVIRALGGHQIAAGPSGSPYRGRRDVLPSGRNLFTTDPRMVPTRAAYAHGVKLAEEFVRRHLQDVGEYPRNLVVDLWGSATMRTAGEEFAMALHLLGVKPKWDEGSERVCGIEILPIAMMDRPRVDVTLRVSGLFRDVFPGLSDLFALAVKRLAARDEASDWNPFVAKVAPARVYGPRPGAYGVGLDNGSEDLGAAARHDAGEAWLSASAWALEQGTATHDPDGIKDRVKAADSFVHLQDLPETDLLMARDYAAHIGGFSAAQAATGGRAHLYHMDNTRPETPRARAVGEELARIVATRAANPDWIKGMRRHGFRGAAEIAATLDHMAQFAHLSEAIHGHSFDAFFEATLADQEVCAFLQEANPEALAAMRDRFRQLWDAGLWSSRRNSIIAKMEL